ncbi:uncharacterized protein LOC131679227 [Topomyia yanbarensis]|uniref:uncharacterized protein LOC131679227 n=1 Tax=Topomyia yanbarensis TaxID=2498891 RepID=UPI00273BEADF|nr:uncharacterized protein LOC131679227 [Topomyia yanbarensis]
MFVKMSNMNDLISIEECVEVIRNARTATNATFKVLNYQVNKIGGQLGYLGEYAYLVVTIEEEHGQTEDLKYFMKCLPFTDPKQRQIVEEVGMFKKEALTYRELFSKFNQDATKVMKWRPSCWLIRDDLLVMEDLTTKGYLAMAYRKDFNKLHMLKIFESMAQMHACSLDLEFNQMNREKLGSKFEPMLYETTFMKDSQWFTVGLMGIMKVALEGSKYALNATYKERISSEMIAKMDEIYQLMEPSDRFQSVVVHRDLWFNNMMFQFEQHPSKGTIDYDKPTSCTLIDFQIARYLPPAVDFWCAIYLLTRRAHRDQYYETYKEYYYQTLGAKLRKLDLDIQHILPWEQFVESLAHYRLVGLLWSGILLGFVNLPEEFLCNLHTNDTKAYYEFCLVNRDEIIMDFFRKDRYYRERLLDTVEEALEYMFKFQ